MQFDSEAELCQSYRESSSTEFVAERTVGKELVKNSAPNGLEGALSFQADLTNKNISSDDEITLVECKSKFKHRAVGQLLMYDWLLRYDARDRAQPIESVNRQLVLGTRPQEVVPTVCFDLSIDPQLWASGGWQSLAQGAQTSHRDRCGDTEILDYLADNAASSLDSPSEEYVLDTPVLNQLPDIQTKHLYREIPVGDNIFTRQSAGFSADVIGYAPQLSTFYIIEVKKQPDVGELQKAIGQSVIYASLFRHDWGIPVENVIPVILIDQAPWITDIYRNSRYDTEQGMFEHAISSTDETVILMNEVGKYK